MLKFVFGAASFSCVVSIALVLADSGAAQAKASPPVVKQLVTFDASVGELPESITTDDDGHVFFSLVNGQIRELLPNNSTVTHATVPVPSGANMIGIKVGPDGFFYTATAGFAPVPPAAFIWRTDPDTGVAEQFAALDPNGFPNDMAFEDDGSFFLTDSFLGRIYHVDGSGNATVAVSDPLLQGNPAAPAFPTHDFGANGIAWDHAKQNLYVSVTDDGRILRFPYRCHTLGKPVLVVQSPQLKGIDGIALDRSGTIYAAINTQNLIATVDHKGKVSVYAESPLFDSPSGVAFGTGPGNKKTAYISNFAINPVLAGTTPHPALLSMPVPVPGADLH
jgi:sugar lactone lactonase YvrE